MEIIFLWQIYISKINICFIWQHSSIFDNFILDVANSILFILKISAKFMISRFCRRKICTYVDMYYAVVDKWWYFDTSKWHTLEIRRTKKEEDLILIWYFLHRCSRTNATVTTNQKESAKSTKKLFWLILFIRQKKRHHRICSSAWLHTICTLGWNLVKNISIWENHNICDMQYSLYHILFLFIFNLLWMIC